MGRITGHKKLRSSTLPPEIVDLVIDELQDSRCSLVSCSLVCHSWLPRSRYHLFRHVTLDMRDLRCETKEQLKKMMSQLPPRIASFRTAFHGNEAIVSLVQGLTLRLTQGCGHCWRCGDLSPPFTKLRYLRIDLYGTVDHIDNFPRLLTILKRNPFLEHLVLENYHFHSHLISDLLQGLSMYTPYLTALTLRGIVGWESSSFAGTPQTIPDDDQCNHHVTPIVLERLYLEDCDERALIQLLASPHLLNLSQLRYFGLRPRFWASLSQSTCEMIQSMEFVSQLTHLALGVYTYVHSVGAGTTWVSPCQDVTHLQLIGDTEFRSLARISMMLNLFPIINNFNKLEHIHISDSPFRIHHRSFDRLLRVVSMSLPSLNQITMSSSNKRSDPSSDQKAMGKLTLAVQLPKTAGTGMLGGGIPCEWWLEPKW